MKIAMTSVSVIDPIAAFKFYTEKLEFIEKTYMPEMNLAIVAAPDDPNGTTILLEPRGGYGSAEFFKGIYDAGLPVIVFGSTNIDSDVERLKAKGVSFKQEPTRSDWGTTAVFDDTCGNFIQIHQP
jgi:predicted enzyme related to lactoylglutathione lyase